MHLPHRQSDLMTDLALQLQESTTHLLARLTPVGAPLTLSSNQDLLAGQPAGLAYLVTQGQPYYRQGAKMVLHLEPGDLLGGSDAMGFDACQYGTDSPVTLEPSALTHLLGWAAQSPGQGEARTSSRVGLGRFHRSAPSTDRRAAAT